MAKSLIQVWIGEHRRSEFTNDSWLMSSSGEPFETEIGTGKVIKGWDEGELRLSAILRVLYRCFLFFSDLLMVINEIRREKIVSR